MLLEPGSMVSISLSSRKYCLHADKISEDLHLTSAYPHPEVDIFHILEFINFEEQQTTPQKLRNFKDVRSYARKVNRLNGKCYLL